VDSHTHFIFSGERSNEFFLRWAGKTYQEIAAQGGGIHNTVRDTASCDDETLLELTREKILDCLKLGTTTLEIKSGYTNSATGELRLLRLIKKLKDQSLKSGGPNIFSTFLALHALPPDRGERDFVDEMISALKQISKEKLCDFVDAFPERGFFSLEETLRFTKAAKKFGLDAKIHADELSNLETSATMAKEKACSVDHLQHISNKGIAELSHATTVATLLPATSFYLGLAYSDARKLIENGVQVALATDYNPGTAPSYSMMQTMMLAAAHFKMSAAEIFCAATFNGAAALDCSDSLGVLQKGYFADICLWGSRTQNPQRFLENLISDQKSPTHVFTRGRLCAL
jgi:imidazolonepropionase